MSEDVYFNEPSYETQAGTPEGAAKNEFYCNIVRYANIKYAMIENIRNPPKGFETIIRRHFYLKKQEIMEEVNKWIKYSETRKCHSDGLISSHNQELTTLFNQQDTYKKELKKVVAELEEELNKL